MYRRASAKVNGVLWQQDKDGISEKAILLQRYNDCLALTQDGHDVLVQVECVEDFIKAIRKIMKEA